MATKPTTVIEWATDLNYSSGPFTGSPTKLNDPVGDSEGSIPGEGIVAEFYNYNIHYLGEWSDWLNSGSFNALEEAHIVETNDDGKSFVAAMELGGGSTSDFALEITENSGAPSSVIVLENTSTGFGIQASVQGDNAVYRGTSQSDSGSVFQALMLGDGIGVDVNCDTGTGIDIETTTGTAINVSSTDGAILVGTTNQSVLGCNITATHPSAVAIQAANNNLASDGFSAGISASNAGTGPGARFESLSGYGATFTALNSTRGAILLTPQNVPGALEEGSIFYNSSQESIGWGYGITGRHFAWGTQAGFTQGFNQDFDTVAVPLFPATVDGVSVNLNTPYEPKAVGYVDILVSGFCDSNVPASSVLEVRIVDVTDGNSTVFDDGITIQEDIQESFCFCVRYLLPSSGVRTFKVVFSAGPNGSAFVRQHSMKITGLYPAPG